LDAKRYLIVTADDFGIGPATTQGILDLASRGLLTGTVLLVNSPHAEAAVRAWRQAGASLELGWHPCLTLDRPVLSAGQVPSLVQPDGRFWPLGSLTRRLCLRQVCPGEIEAELRAQWQRFQDLVGRPPTLVNSHHHVQVFPPIGALLRKVLHGQRPLPYLRRIREPWSMLARVPGARGKRGFLSLLGGVETRRQRRDGFPGNDWLAGVTDPPHVADPAYLSRWLTRVPGRVVELTCHPGHMDTTLIGRDCTAGDGLLLRRVRELHLLRHASFPVACRTANFSLLAPSELSKIGEREHIHAA
jgi:predicted glycoside hydrolase/deacetylase ChbG (UPF0249 family)